MSTTTVLALVAVGAVVAVWQTRRALREPLERDRIIAAARSAAVPATPLVPPAPDNMPGINLADWDECVLLWCLPEQRPESDHTTTEGDL